MDTYLTQYQSHHLTDDEIKANFIVRQDEFSEVIDDIRNTEIGSSFKHFVFVGRRGSGKSTLLRRIEAEINSDEALTSKHIVLNLGEEQSGIYKLHDLWDKVVQSLNTFGCQIKEQDFRAFDDIKDYSKKLHSEIIACIQRENKQLILLIDNIDRILKSVDDGLLREQLMNHLDIRIVGGSTHMSEEFWSYDKPFYEFFTIRRLQPLTTKEIVSLLDHWGKSLNKPELKSYPKKYPGKIQSIRILTDGMPRTMLLFVKMLINREEQNGYEYLQQIVDRATPIYQERLGTLTPPQQKILTELAFNWEAATIKELVPRCKMESKLISSYMAQLVDFKYVEKLKGEKRNLYYRVEERFFNLWMIMTQGGPKERQEAKYLSEFLEVWYDKDELKEVLKSFEKRLAKRELKMDYTLSMSRALLNSGMISNDDKKQLYLSLRTDAQLPKSIVGENIKYYPNLSEEIRLAFENRDYIKAIKLLEIYEATDGSKEHNLGLAHFTLGQIGKASEFYEKALALGNVEAAYELAVLKQEQGEIDEAIELYEKAIGLGNVESANNLAVLMQERGELEEAETLYHKALELGSMFAANNLASLKHERGDLEEAEKLYRKALELGDVNAAFNLAQLKEDQGELVDAEYFYLKAIEESNSEAAVNLAILKQNQGHLREAESLFQKGIELGNLRAIYNLAVFKEKQNSIEEAEQLYRMAIASGDSEAAFNLAYLKESQGELTQAEELYELAMKNGSSRAINNLALIKQENSELLDAEALFKMAINAGYLSSFRNLLLLYLEYNKKESLVSIVESDLDQFNKMNNRLRCIVYLLIGEMNIYQTLFEEIILKNQQNSARFVMWLLKLKQLKAVQRIFQKMNIIDQFLPLYYATHVLESSDTMASLPFPPELQHTIDNIVNEIKDYHKKYF